MTQRRSGFRARLREPIVVDRNIDLASALTWFFIGLWGIFSALGTQGRVDIAYLIPWGLCITATAFIAAGAAGSMFFTASDIGLKMRHKSWMIPAISIRILRKKIEMYALCLMCGLIGVHPLLDIIRAFFDSSFNAAAGAMLGILVLIFPTWRVIHLTRRIRALRRLGSTGEYVVVPR